LNPASASIGNSVLESLRRTPTKADRQGCLGNCEITHALGQFLSMAFAQVPGKSIKGKVKKKNFSGGWNFSTFAAHLIEQDLF